MRSIAAMTESGRARLKAEGLSEYAIDEIAESAFDAPEVKRHAASVGYIRRLDRVAGLAVTPPADSPIARPITTMGTPLVPAAPAAVTTKARPMTPEGWKAEWAASAELQAEFATADRYVNYQNGLKAGRIRFAGGGRAGPQVARSFVTAKG